MLDRIDIHMEIAIKGEQLSELGFFFFGIFLNREYG